jgi:hypothetical protein
LDLRLNLQQLTYSSFGNVEACVLADAVAAQQSSEGWRLMNTLCLQLQVDMSFDGVLCSHCGQHAILATQPIFIHSLADGGS